MRSPSRLVPVLVTVLVLLAVLSAVAAMVLPWIRNPECRMSDRLWQVPTRRHPATITLVTAMTSVALVGMIGVLTLARAGLPRSPLPRSPLPRSPLPRSPLARSLLPRAAMVAIGATALAYAVVAAITLPRSSCFWDDSLGGGSSESVWGPGPVLLLGAGLLALVTGLLTVGSPATRAGSTSDAGAVSVPVTVLADFFPAYLALLEAGAPPRWARSTPTTR